MEAFGGAGYVEDTGLPVLLRDAQVLPIWEGTTNVLALDALRAMGESDKAFRALEALVRRTVNDNLEGQLGEAARQTQAALKHAELWLAEARQKGQAAVEAGARRFALTLGRMIESTLLIEQAQWSADHESDNRASAAARIFASSGIDLIIERDVEDVTRLMAK